MTYEALNADKVIDTVARLRQRIEERFPQAGLGGVCTELQGLATKAREVIEEARRPILWLRIVTGVLIGLVSVGLGTTVYGLSAPQEPLTLTEFVQLLEAGINDLVLIGLGFVFVISAERRVKRKRILAAIHELRSLAHIVDMHQLTKDPSHQLHEYADTASSPKRALNRLDLSRYLDYCSEMLSLTGKVAALYVEQFDDAVVLAAVNEVEALATGLSGKVWQKLMILEGVGS